MSNRHDNPEHLLYVARVKALEALLIEKKLVTTDTINKFVKNIEKASKNIQGKTAVAKAWIDASYKKRLLSDTKEVFKELGVNTLPEKVIVVENTPTIHNLVVCTLCSCYPIRIMGFPPDWYASFAYRSRATLEPRKLLADFGYQIPKHIEIRVWDTTAHKNFLVLPMQPIYTKGMDEKNLINEITTEMLVGAAVAKNAGVIQ